MQLQHKAVNSPEISINIGHTADWGHRTITNKRNVQSRPTISNTTKLTNVGNHLPEEEPTFPRYANYSSNIKETKAVQNTLRAQGI